MASFTISGVSPPLDSISVKKTGDSVERFQNLTGSTVTYAAIKDGISHNYTVSIVKDGCPATSSFDLTCNYTKNGNLDEVTCTLIRGWVADVTNKATIAVDIKIDGVTVVSNLSANIARPDVAVAIDSSSNTLFGFEYTVPATYQTTGTHTVTVFYAGTTTQIPASPKTYTCATTNLTVWGTCSNNSFTFTSTNNGNAVEYRAIGITDWSTNAGPYTVGYDSHSSPYTLQARYVGNPSSEVTASYSPFTNCVSINPTVSLGACTGGAGTGVLNVTVPTGSYANNYAVQLQQNSNPVAGQADKNINPGLGLNESWSNLADGTYSVILYQRTPYAFIKTVDTKTISCTTTQNCTPFGNDVVVTSSTSGTTTTLGVSGTGIIGSTTYSWSGNGLSSTSATPTVTIPTTTGSYTYTVVLTNTNGTGTCTKTVSKTFTVSPSGNTVNVECINNSTIRVSGTFNPTGNLYIELRNGSGTGTAVTNKDGVPNTTGTYTWDFDVSGYGQKTYYAFVRYNDQNYIISSTGTVCGTSTTQNCTAITSANITIPTPSTTTTGSTITLTASGGASGATYVWSGGTISSSGTVTLGAAGTPVTYTVTVTNPGTGTNCSATKSITITPTSSTSSTATASCSGTTLTFSGNLAGASRIAAELFKDGVSQGNIAGYDNVLNPITNGTVTVSGTGTYYVKFRQTNNDSNTINSNTTSCSSSGGCTSIGTLTISSSSTPTKGGTATLSVSGTGLIAGTTYSWSGPGGFSSTSTTPSVTFPSSDGTYTYSVTATNTDGTGTCTASTTFQVVFSSSGTNSIVATITCTSVTITSGSIPGAGAVSAWLRNSSGTTIGQLYDNRSGSSLTGSFTTFTDNSSINLTSGTYYVFARQTGNDANNISSSQVSVTCGSTCTPPSASMTVSQNGTANAGFNRYTFTITGSNGNPNIYGFGNWSYTGGTLISGAGSSNSAVIEFPIPSSGSQSYTVSAEVSNGCNPAASANKTVTLGTPTQNSANIDCGANNLLTITGYIAGANAVTIILHKPDNTTETIFDNNSSIVSNGTVNATYSLASYPSGSYYVVIKNGDTNTATSTAKTCGGGSTCVPNWVDTVPLQTRCNNCVNQKKQVNQCNSDEQWVTNSSGSDCSSDPNCTNTCTPSSGGTINVSGTLGIGNTITYSISGVSTNGSTITDYEWTFPGGSLTNITSDHSSISVTYSTSGTKTVSVKVVDSCSNHTVTKPVVIPSGGCTPVTTTNTGNTKCYNTGSGCVSQVEKTDGCSTWWANEGNYCNCPSGQTRNSACNCESIICSNPAPNQNATLDATVGGNATNSVIVNTEVAFAFNNVGPTSGDNGSYSWSMKKNNVTQTYSNSNWNAFITFTECGSYELTATYTNCAGSVTKSATVTVSGCSTNSISVSIANPVCLSGGSTGSITVNYTNSGYTKYRYTYAANFDNINVNCNTVDGTISNGTGSITLPAMSSGNFTNGFAYISIRFFAADCSQQDKTLVLYEQTCVTATASPLNECTNSGSIQLGGFNQDIRYAWSSGTTYTGTSYENGVFASPGDNPIISNVVTNTNAGCNNFVVRVWAYSGDTNNRAYKDVPVTVCTNVCSTCPCMLPTGGEIRIVNLTGFGDNFYYEFDSSYSVDGLSGNCRLLAIETTTVQFNNQVPNANSVITSHSYSDIRNALVDSITNKKALYAAWAMPTTPPITPIVFVRTVCCQTVALGANDSRTCWNNASPVYGDWVKIN